MATAAAAAALSGPLHGGANEEVLKMIDEIGSKDRVPAYIEAIKAGKGKLMGFGHRVYKNYDPRARIIKEAAEQVFEVTGKNPKLDIALELERIALEDEYFIKRKLYPNVDFYSGIIYQAMGFQPEMFTVLFAIPRTAGWLAQWEEMVSDPEQKIARPRQIYTGITNAKSCPWISAKRRRQQKRHGQFQASTDQGVGDVAEPQVQGIARRLQNSVLHIRKPPRGFAPQPDVDRRVRRRRRPRQLHLQCLFLGIAARHRCGNSLHGISRLGIPTRFLDDLQIDARKDSGSKGRARACPRSGQTSQCAAGG